MSDTEERPAIPMELDLRVDILDNEGIWNTGQIVDMSRDEEDMVEIKYDGWGDEYNEWIPLSSQRLAPLHMFTMVKKCWAKLTKWPWWPAFVVLRAPTRKSAADALNAESKVYVEFFDSYNEGKRSRCWMQKKNIASFQEGFDERASKNIGKNFPAYVEGTQRAIAGGSPVLFSGNGTLPIEFSSRYAEPLAARKLALAGNDEDKWFEAYRIFSNRYRVLYGYDFAKDSTTTLLGAAKRAKGKNADSASARAADEDNDDDSEVEILETVPPAKRGRGRPPKGKQPKKQPEYFADEGDDNDEDEAAEEKNAADDDEYHDTGDDAEDDDDDAAHEEPESPRGRRSARMAKRKPVTEDEPRRSTRPRRAKDGEEDTVMDDDDEGEDSTHYEYYEEHSEEDDSHSLNGYARSSSRSASPDTRAPRTTFQSKTHKRSALTQLMASTQPQPVFTEPVSSPPRRRKSLLSESLMQELEAAVTGSPTSRRGTSAESSPRSMTRPRRKSANPQPLSSTLTASRECREQTAFAGSPCTANEQPSLRYWLGFGAGDEGIHTGGGSRAPWSIQNWLLSGFRRKQTSDCLADDN